MTTNFSGPDWNDTVNSSDTNARNDTCAAHPGDIVGRCLENGTEQGPQASEDNSLDTTHAIGQRTSDEGANQGASIVDRNYSAQGSDVSRVSFQMSK